MTIRLSQNPDGFNAPLYLALDKGFYKEEGLDVSILRGKGGSMGLTLVANGTDTFAWGGAGAVMEAASKGLPVKHVATFQQVAPDAFVSLADSGIKEPKDLEGKKVGLPPGSSLTPMVEPFFKATGVNKDKVEFVAAAWNLGATLLADKQVDSFVTWCFTVPATLEAKGFQTSCIRFGDYGFNILGQGLIANSFYIRQNPEVVKGAVKASIRGFQEAIKDPEAAVKAAKKGCEECDEGVLRSTLKRAFDLYHTKKTAGWIPGKAAPEDWAESMKILVEYSELDERIPAEAYYDYSFLPQ